MKNIIKKVGNINIELSSTLKLSSAEWLKLSNSMTRVAEGFSAFAVKNLPKGQMSLSLQLCGKGRIQSLNKKFRKKDKITDVLSFQMQDNVRTLKKWPLPENHLGDVFICREKAISQARQFKISESDEWIHLAVHGILHLCGFDHEISTKEELVMQKNEKWIIDYISKKKRK